MQHISRAARHPIANLPDATILNAAVVVGKSLADPGAFA